MLGNKISGIFLVLIITAHTFILTKIIFFPYPELFIYPYLTNHGLKPYSQILDQHFPGLMFLPINFDNLGMNNETTARIWLIGVVVLTQLLLFWISRSIIKSNSKALLVNLLYLIWQPFFEGWVLWIDNFLPILLLPAFYYVYRKRFILAGIFLGVGIIFKQTLVPLSILVLFYILWSEKNLKVGARYLLGLIPPIALMVLYFIGKGVFFDFLYWTVIFNLTTYAATGTQSPKSVGFVTRILFVYISSLSQLFYQDKRLKVILLIFLVGSLAGAFDRANFVHLQPSLPFVVLGTAWGFYSLVKRKIILLAICIYAVITVWWLSIFYKGHLSNKVLFFDQQTYALANKIKRYTRPGEKIFVFGAAPHLYQMSQTLPAGDVFVFQFPWFLQVAGDKVLAGIKTDQPNIIVADQTVEIEGIKIIDFASQIDQYININYKKIDSVGTAEIMRRK